MKATLSREYQIDHPELAISRENILRSLQVPVNEHDPYLEDLIHELTLQARDICEPRACYSLFEKPAFPDMYSMSISSQTFAFGRIITSSLRLSSHIAFFIGTAGYRIEQTAGNLFSHGQSLEGLILNLIGSEIAESAAAFIHAKIGEEMKTEGLNITNRYSPGYCGWPVSDQKLLFGLMQGNTCGVRLTDSSLMLPIKSVSGVIGIGKQVKNKSYSCSKCDADFCLYRDKK